MEFTGVRLQHASEQRTSSRSGVRCRVALPCGSAMNERLIELECASGTTSSHWPNVV